MARDKAKEQTKESAAPETPSEPAPNKVVEAEEKPEFMAPEAWGEELDVPDWKVAGMMAAMGWATGKVVVESEFKAAVKAFDKRGQGTGRIGQKESTGKKGD